MKKVGFIGTGIMGQAMARNLMKAGFRLTVYSRTKEKAEPLLQEGAIWADSIAQCAKDKDAVITMVGYPRDVEGVYLGPGGILESANPGTVLIDMTTSEPALARKIAMESEKKGLCALDAPVSGGEMGAIKGSLVIMAGGEGEVFHRAMPLFEAMGENIRLLGPAGSGQHCKAANQIGIAGAMAGLCEAIAYTRAAGLDPAEVIAAIRTGSAGSTQMEVMGPKILAGDDSPTFYLKHLLKDLEIVLGECEKLGRTLPQTEGVTAAYRTLAQRGLGDCGSQSLIRFYD